jgi:toxin YhaV
MIIGLWLQIQHRAQQEYRQGSTLGSENRHWHRAKYSQQYRLFFRFHNRSKVIVLGWVNDTATKRASIHPTTGKNSFRKQARSASV